MLLMLIAIGGALGAVARYTIGEYVGSHMGTAFPWGTLLVNVSGSLVLAFSVRALETMAAPPEYRGFLAIGLCGAFTTFSTFSHETVLLMQAGQWNRATLYMFASVLLSLAATIAGFGLAGAAIGTRT